ncbi:MAG TPA: ABC transporter permease [Gaiellaceae bacterium]|nr:ABC transporter permease [Gaiellaceae bacterium]
MTAAAALGGRVGTVNVRIRRRRRLVVAGLVAPALLVVCGALLVPAVNLIVQSFLESSGYGGVVYHFTFSNYLDAVRDPTYRTVAWHSFGLGALAALICVVAGYPAAYFITFRLHPRWRNLALFLVVVSLFTSYLVRLYAWYTILGGNGIVNTALIHLGIVNHPLLFLLFSRWAVLIAFVNVFLPYSVLMLTSAMQNIRPELLENARDLGASPVRTFSRVVLPLTMTGAVGAFVYTFILTSGDYITPSLLGGTSSTSLANIVSDEFVALGDRPGGAAISCVMLLVFFAVYLALSRLERWKGI